MFKTPSLSSQQRFSDCPQFFGLHTLHNNGVKYLIKALRDHSVKVHLVSSDCMTKENITSVCQPNKADHVGSNKRLNVQQFKAVKHKLKVLNRSS